MYDPADELKPSETALTILLHKYTFQHASCEIKKKSNKKEKKQHVCQPCLMVSLGQMVSKCCT